MSSADAETDQASDNNSNSNNDTNDNNSNINNESFGSGVGYTPLQETNVMSMMMMASSSNNENDDSNDGMTMSNLTFTMAPPPSYGDDDGDGDEWDFEDHHDNSSEKERKEEMQYQQSEGAFYANFEHNNNDTENDINGSNSTLDYNTLAEQALQHLMEDYSATISSTSRNNDECTDTNDVATATGDSGTTDDNATDDVTNTNTSESAGTKIENESTLIDGKEKEKSITNECVTISSIDQNDNKSDGDEDDKNAGETTPNCELFNTTFPEDIQSPISESTTTTSAKTVQTPSVSTTTTINENNESKTNINKEAITKAMNNIRLKASSNLITKLDTGSGNKIIQSFYPKNANVPTEHPLIPKNSLLAFQRGNTMKSIDATARLTRSATLADALIRICESGMMEGTLLEKQGQNNESGTDVFVIHVIGSDHVECSSKETVKQAIGPFVQWFEKASRNIVTTTNGEGVNKTVTSSPIAKILSSFKHLRIEFLGPNVPIDATKRQPAQLFPTSKSQSGDNITVKKKTTGIQTAVAICKNCLYHDYLKDLQQNCNGGINHLPHFMISYNSGIWGYDSWKPTLQAMNNILPFKTPFIITSYTLLEAEDDTEVIQEIFRDLNKNEETDKHKGSMMWGPTTNPFGSRKLRKTVTNPGNRPYFENSAWQVWLMGSS
jgi:hypothetical protein